MTSGQPDHNGAAPRRVSEGAGSRERILEAALRLFREFGYEGTSVTKIAQSAGMTPANLYWHFASKQDLLTETLAGIYRRSFRELEESIPDGDAVVRLSAYVRAYVNEQLTELREERNFGYASLASSLPPEGKHHLLEFGRPYLQLLRQIIEQGIAEGVFDVKDIKVASLALSTMCEYVFTWYRPDRSWTAEYVMDYYVELALRMLGHDGVTH